ncbi:unnamed protein product [Allacma fusca]|uniref:Uncharacterized protein n=1 Tax=Allacma fusca TaxID=39272 RepID=A0A8J2L2I0_9HEXA|nr:unnamed protein product [Allacma fusca]
MNPRLENYVNIGKQTSVLCSEDLSESISSVAYSNKSIAYLTTSIAFESNWRAFELAMKNNPRIKFAYNVDSDDSYLRRVRGFWVPDGLDELSSRWVPHRLNALLTSGVYWFWEKWEKIYLSKQHEKSKKKPRGRNSLPSNKNADKGIAFQDSQLLLTFYVLASGYIFSSFVLVLEYSCKILQRKGIPRQGRSYAMSN